MSKTFSLTEKQRGVLFDTISNWHVFTAEDVYAGPEPGSYYHPEEQAEEIANYEAQCYELSAVLNKAGFVDSVFHYHVGQEFAKTDGQCQVCQERGE